MEASGFLQLEGLCLLGVSLCETTCLSLFLFSMVCFLPASAEQMLKGELSRVVSSTKDLSQRSGGFGVMKECLCRMWGQGRGYFIAVHHHLLAEAQQLNFMGIIWGVMSSLAHIHLLCWGMEEKCCVATWKRTPRNNRSYNKAEIPFSLPRS